MKAKENKRLHPNIVYRHDTESNMLLPYHVTEKGYMPATEYFITENKQSNEIDFSKYPKIIHVVNEGEWLWKIARFYWGEDEDVMLNQVVAEMKINNDLFSEVIDIGDELIVPVRLEKLKKILKNDDLFEIYKSYVKYDAKTALNPDGIALEKPNSALIEETRNQIISKIKFFIKNFDIFDYLDMFGFLIDFSFFFGQGAGMQYGLIYIENDGLYFLINVEGGAGFDVGVGFKAIWGEGVDHVATAEDIEGISFNTSTGLFNLSFEKSYNYDKERKEVGKKFIATSIGYTPPSFGIKALSLKGTKGLFKYDPTQVETVSYTNLFKISIDYFEADKKKYENKK